MHLFPGQTDDRSCSQRAGLFYLIVVLGNEIVDYLLMLRCHSCELDAHTAGKCGILASWIRPYDAALDLHRLCLTGKAYQHGDRGVDGKRVIGLEKETAVAHIEHIGPDEGSRFFEKDVYFRLTPRALPLFLH